MPYLKFIKLFIFTILFSTILNAQEIVINEVVTSNSTVNTDEDGSYEDWIELYNSGSQAINLNGCGLSDDSNPFKWVFPNVSLGSGEYLLIWCSDKNRKNPAFPLHTNFKISSSGETITLTDPLGTIIDQLSAVSIPSNYSYGINTSGSYSFYSLATPGAINSTQSYTEILSDPVFSVNSGFYSHEFSLNITHEDPAVIILYSIDGSEPNLENLNGKTYFYKNGYQEFPENPDGTLIENKFETLNYTAPLEINDRTPLPNKISIIPKAFFNYQYYIPTAPILKGTVIRAKVLKDGALSSKTITKNYYITPQAEKLFTLPVVAINLDENLLFEYENGINVPGKDFDDWRALNPSGDANYSDANYKRSGDAAEVKGNFSYFVNGNEILNQDIGMRIHGGATRVFPNKSIRIYARSEYGNNNFNYPFFNDVPDLSFKTLILRNSGNDVYSTYFRDAFIHKTVSHLNLDTQAYQPTVVFLNSEYWGLLNLRERYDKHYFNRVYGIEETELDFLEANGLVQEGDNIHYSNMLNFIQNNSLTEQENYSYIKTQLDPENYIDYFSTEIFIRNTDWPGNNIEFFRKKTAFYEPFAPYGQDGRWRWVLKDTDFGFGNYSGELSYQHDTLAFATLENGPDWPNPDWSTLLFRKLLENNEFKNQFINRFADLMNTTFLPARVKSIIEEMKTGIEAEIGAHRQRWNDGTISQWNTEIETMKTFADKRPAEQRNHILQKFAINSTINATLEVSSVENGYIKINSIEIKEGTPAIVGNPYPWTGVYFEGIPVKLKAVALPGFEFSHWSGASESTAEEITVTPSDDFSIQAHFVVKGTIPQTETIYFWLMDSNIANNQPLTTLNTTFKAGSVDGFIDYQSCLIGYPFTSADANWRRASMERRNNPTDINYIPEANSNLDFASSDMKGLQIKEPFYHSDGQGGTIDNTLIFNIPTTGYKDIKLSFAGINELTNATTFSLDYSLNSGTPIFAVSSLFPITNAYQLFNYDLSSVVEANNNPDLKIRMRFFGTNMSADTGARITFNNIAVHGTKINLGVDENSTLQFSVYPNPFSNNINVTGINNTKSATYKLFTIDGKLIKKGNLSNAPIYLNDLSGGMYLLQLSSDGKIETKKIIKK